MSDELRITEDAYAAAVEGLLPIVVDKRDINAVLWSAAPLIVAAELRRQADLLWGTTSDGDDICEALQARADELDPAGAR